MTLDAWQRRPVFRNDDRGACREDLTVSVKGGRQGEPDPIISEQGRLFLSEQLHRLTPEHACAIFRAARVDQMGDTHHRDRFAPEVPAIDAWVAVFQNKVQQIDARRCQPAD
jgi:hypothetical protein